MTTQEAAAVIGCTPQQVRTLIRAGRLKARPIKVRGIKTWVLDAKSVRSYADKPQKQGWRRGLSRK